MANRLAKSLRESRFPAFGPGAWWERLSVDHGVKSDNRNTTEAAGYFFPCVAIWVFPYHNWLQLNWPRLGKIRLMTLCDVGSFPVKIPLKASLQYINCENVSYHCIWLRHNLTFYWCIANLLANPRFGVNEDGCQ